MIKGDREEGKEGERETDRKERKGARLHNSLHKDMALMNIFPPPPHTHMYTHTNNNESVTNNFFFEFIISLN